MKEKGQATVELALTLSILMILFVSLIDIGLIYYNKLLVNHIGSEVVSIVRKQGEESDVQVYLESQSQLDLNNLALTYTPTIPATKDALVTINIQYKISIIGPVTSVILGTEYTINEKYVTKVE